MPEVLIVGAGIVGCAVAERLAAAGASVRVLDPRPAGQGATQASAGVLAPYIEGHASETLRSLGRRSLDLYDGFIARASRGGPVEYHRNGTFEVALDEAGAARLAAAAAGLAGLGVEAELVPASAIRRRAPHVSPAATAALLVPVQGFVAASALTAALREAALAAGAVFEHGRVTAIARGAGKVVVATTTGAAAAERVVLAAGSWAGQIPIEGVDPPPVRPVRGQLLHLDAGVEGMDQVVWGEHCYLVPWADGTVLVGATVEDAGFDERATAAGVGGLLAAAAALVPPLADAAFTAVRVGLRPWSPDDLPLVGASEAVPGLVYAIGHYRNGILLAPLTAALVENIVTGAADDPALAPLSPSRFGHR
ncbi:MAG: glycine oxidase ThiO [Vicinamibacterales bacterium]